MSNELVRGEAAATPFLFLISLFIITEHLVCNFLLIILIPTFESAIERIIKYKCQNK